MTATASQVQHQFQPPWPFLSYILTCISISFPFFWNSAWQDWIIFSRPRTPSFFSITGVSQLPRASLELAPRFCYNAAELSIIYFGKQDTLHSFFVCVWGGGDPHGHRVINKENVAHRFNQGLLPVFCQLCFSYPAGGSCRFKVVGDHLSTAESVNRVAPWPPAPLIPLFSQWTSRRIVLFVWKQPGFVSTIWLARAILLSRKGWLTPWQRPWWAWTWSTPSQIIKSH